MSPCESRNGRPKTDLAPGPVIIRLLSGAETAHDPDELDLYRQGWVLGCTATAPAAPTAPATSP